MTYVLVPCLISLQLQNLLILATMSDAWGVKFITDVMGVRVCYMPGVQESVVYGNVTHASFAQMCHSDVPQAA